MGMVAPQQRIASAFFVFCGQYGDVSRYAQERGVCRQWVYREAAWLKDFLTQQQESERLRGQEPITDPGRCTRSRSRPMRCRGRPFGSVQSSIRAARAVITR